MAQASRYEMNGIILETNLPLKVFAKGKVRDIYDLGDRLLMVATDRISAFDCIIPNGIPCKGRVLTAISIYWFNYTRGIMRNHLITGDIKKFPDDVRDYSEILKGRSMLVWKAKRIDIECVVRGYLSGSAWEEYKETGEVCGIELPPGLVESEKLPKPIFTPAIKSSSGHDENISEKRAAELIGNELKDELKKKSIEIYQKASKRAESSGIIIADTKFEFGLKDKKNFAEQNFCAQSESLLSDSGDRLILIDEILTPDSSRFWSKDEYREGGPQKSFDKQFVRDYLGGIGWNKEPPAPKLPEGIVQKTSEKYLTAYRLITGKNISGE